MSLGVKEYSKNIVDINNEIATAKTVNYITHSLLAHNSKVK